MRKATLDEQKARFVLRQAFSRSMWYWGTLRRVKRGPNEYECEGCHKVFKLREMAVDHTIPVVDIERGWEGIVVFAHRLFCEFENLKALCQDNCHAYKTKQENYKRKHSNG